LKITIQQEDLNNALSVVHSVVPAKTTMPILTCVLMEAGEEGLRLSATNLDISVTTVTDKVEVKEPGRIAVPAGKFISFARTLAPGEVQIEDKAGSFRVIAGKSSLTESSMNVDEFPNLPEIEQQQALELDSTGLVAMIKETAYAISRDETRPALMGIKWEIKPTNLTMVATDAHRLARSKRNMEWGVTEDRELIADTQGLMQFVRLAEGAKKVGVHIGSNQLSFNIGDTTLHTRLLDGQFPDYTAVIPKDNDLLLTVDRESLMSSVRRVSITADRITSQVRMGLEKQSMELSATGADGSRTEDQLPVNYDGTALEIGFNYNYLLDVLKNIRSDNIQILLKDPQSAALIAPAGESDSGDELLCLLMPLRLTSD